MVWNQATLHHLFVDVNFLQRSDSTCDTHKSLNINNAQFWGTPKLDIGCQLTQVEIHAHALHAMRERDLDSRAPYLI